MERTAADAYPAASISWRVLVLEDDEELRERILLPGLADYGFEATGAGTAADLYRHMLFGQYDIAVLDIGLPGEDGISVARHLRQLSPMGIVMLSGNHGREDHVRALTVGADTYLSKPVDIELLAASLHSLARRLRPATRNEPATAAPLPPSRGEWRLETQDWCLHTPRNTTMALSSSERCVMQQLFAAAGATVPREALIATLCRDVYNFDPHRLEMLIYRLRRKAREQGEMLPLVTMRGVGYAFVRDGEADLGERDP
jgi:DNA-binding response OmpR family regulator